MWAGEALPVDGQVRGRYHVWAIVDLRRGLVGWTVTEQLGQAPRRRRYLHLDTARNAYARAEAATREYMESLVGLVGWSTVKGVEGKRYELQR